MLTQEQFELVKEVFMSHGWGLPDRFHYQYSFHKNDYEKQVFCSIHFKQDEVYCQLNDFGTYVPNSDIENKSANEIYQIVLKFLEDQFSDYLSKYTVDLKRHHEFMLAQIKEI